MANERILVVDDEEPLCEVLQLNLENEGYDIAFSAEEALGLDLKEYSLILLDIMMGEISGIKIAKMLKADVATAHIPIIILYCTRHGGRYDNGFEPRCRRLHHETLYHTQCHSARKECASPFVIRQKQ